MFDDKKLAEMVREKEQRAAVSDGRMPVMSKDIRQSMSLKMDRFTSRKEDYQPQKNVVINTIQANDSVDAMKAEQERKRREEDYKRRMEQIRNMYSRDKSQDQYNQDYSYFYVCLE